MTELRAATLDLTEHILIGVLWLAGVTVGTTIRLAGTGRIERMWGPVDFNLDQDTGFPIHSKNCGTRGP